VKRHGLDLLNVSIGFSTSASGFMTPIAARVREEAGIPVATAWSMDERGDCGALNRSCDDRRPHDPHYPLRAARELQVRKLSTVLPAQYAYWLALSGSEERQPVD
jgi:hypothetical protein